MIAAAQAAFNHAIKEETGKSPKEWYEGQVAVTAEPIPKHGANQHTGAVDNVNSKTDGGNSADYTRRRLARDRPDLLEKVAEGGLTLNAAAIEAGFRKKPSPFEPMAEKSTGKPWKVLVSLVQEYDPNLGHPTCPPGQRHRHKSITLTAHDPLPALS